MHFYYKSYSLTFANFWTNTMSSGFKSICDTIIVSLVSEFSLLGVTLSVTVYLFSSVCCMSSNLDFCEMAN